MSCPGLYSAQTMKTLQGQLSSQHRTDNPGCGHEDTGTGTQGHGDKGAWGHRDRMGTQGQRDRDRGTGGHRDGNKRVSTQGPDGTQGHRDGDTGWGHRDWDTGRGHRD